jgi:hypothetical protein
MGSSRCCSVGGRRSISCSTVASSNGSETTSRSWVASSAIACAAAFAEAAAAFAEAVAAGVADVGGAGPKENAGRKVWLRQERHC